MARDVKTVGDLIRRIARRFARARLHYGHGTDNANDEAAWLVLSALGIGFGEAGERMGEPVAKADRARVEALADRRIRERMPVAYLLNEAWFAGLRFYVDQRVLVPRSPIAELIGERFAPWLAEEGVRSILDIGTGSGCIAIACALAFPEARVVGVDDSGDALEVARMNVAQHAVEDRVELVQGDLYAGVAGRTFDLIVTNPPYVPRAEYEALPPEYGHEPRAGLEAGADGLDVMRLILAGARRHLSPSGVLVGEVGSAAPALEAAFPDLPFTWLDFERGGEGVFLISAQDLPCVA